MSLGCFKKQMLLWFTPLTHYGVECCSNNKVLFHLNPAPQEKPTKGFAWCAIASLGAKNLFCRRVLKLGVVMLP